MTWVRIRIHLFHGGPRIRIRIKMQWVLSNAQCTFLLIFFTFLQIRNGFHWMPIIVLIHYNKSNNNFQVYEGLYAMSVRDFKKSATLFLDAISTFTSYELMDYVTFVQYTVYISILALDRLVHSTHQYTSSR